ncbi:FAD-binding oxidoreductase [Flavobacteriaceae bacterium]|nr:FAD-binding oxidoreductase [Flavobacteriaceae bacterium]
MGRYDFGIVGYGLAGLAIAKRLRDAGKTVLILSDDSQQSSLVAGGVWNPVILKRFTPVWRGAEFLDLALGFYKEIELELDMQFLEYFDTYRILKDVAEQNNFIAASDHIALNSFLDPVIQKNSNSAIQAPFGLGRVKGTGKLKVRELLLAYAEQLDIATGHFDYDKFDPENPKINGIEVGQLIFAEGFGMHWNPFFNYLPLKHSKGEVLTIHAPQLKMELLLKAGVFVLPLGEDLYKVGATYNWKDITNEISDKAREELLTKLNPMIDVPFKIIDQKAGIRPTVVDRRPLIGVHPIYKKLSVINGLGTRGVMNAPFASLNLVNHLLFGEDLDPIISIDRFVHHMK